MRLRVARRTRYTHMILVLIICVVAGAYLLRFVDQPVKSDIVTLAKKYLGTSYRYGGATPDGFDCSGYIMYLFGQFGKDLPRTADRQATIGTPVARDKLRPGDVVFFATDSEPGVSHAGLYIGDGLFIHASSGAKKVIISKLTEPYWQKAFHDARKLLPD